MTLPRTVADVAVRACGVRGGVHRPDVSQRLRAAVAVRGRAGRLTCTSSWGCRSPRRRRWPDHRRVRRRDAPLRRDRAGAVGGLREGPAQGRRDARAPGRVPRRPHEGVLFVGRAQEKTALFRTEKAPRRRRQVLSRGSSRPPGWSTTSTSTAWTPTSGRSSSSSAPTSRTTPSCASTATSGPSGRPPRPGSGSTRWTTRSPRSTTRPRCRRSATSWDPEQIDALLRKWLAILPHPFTAADRAAGYRYDISILQAEFSLTQMLDAPVSGRIFFEQVIRDNLDLGRPDQVSLIFDRRLIHRPARHPRTVPHPGHHRRGHPEPARRLQALQDQAVPQGRTGAAHRDHHQRHPRLRDRQTADQPARPAGGRLLRQPAPARRPTTQPRPDHRQPTRSPPSPTPSPPPPGPASPACASPSPAATPCCPRCCSSGSSPAASPTATCATSPPSSAACPDRHRRADHLRPAPAAHPRPHRTHPAHPPLPGHRHRPAHRHVPHPRPRPAPPHRPRPLTAPPRHPARYAPPHAYQTAIDHLTRQAGLAA